MESGNAKGLKAWICAHKKRMFLVALLLFCGSLLGIVVLEAIPPREDGIAYLIGVSQPNMTDNFELELYNDINEQCTRHGSMRFVSYDAGHSEEKQKQDIDNLLKLGLDALIVVTFEPQGLEKTIQKAYDTGIPVIVIGYAPEGVQFSTHIYTDNEEIGRMAGEYVRKLSNIRQCTVLEIQGEPHSRITLDLKKGFSGGIAPYDNITKEYVMTGYWSQEKTRARMYESDFFSKEPPINVIFAHNDMMALGAAVNLRQTRKSAYIISVGGYSVKNSDLTAIKEGLINATFTYPTGGAEAMEVIIQLLGSEETPKEIVLKSELVTIENVDVLLRTGELE